MGARAVRVAAASLLVACGAATALGAACGGTYGATEPTPVVDASPDAVPGVTAATDPCEHAAPPPAPTLDDDPGAVLPPFVLAVTDDIFEVNGIFGFDLDGVCTCDTRPGTARGGGESCARRPGTSVRCDVERGIDNTLADLFLSFSAFFDLAAVPQKLIRRGSSTALVHVSGYNGRANDKDVTVGVMHASGILTQGCPSSAFDSQEKVWSPGWCGDDAWSLRPETVIGSSGVPAVSGRGYVTDHRLVVHLAGTMRLPFNEDASIGLADPTISGKLVPLGEDLQPRDPARAPVGREARLWELREGVFAGRIPVRDAVGAVGALRVTGDGGRRRQVCQEVAFASIKQAICEAVDLPRATSLDFDPSAACDALSTAMPFSAKPALTGPVAEPDPQTGPCVPNADGEPADAGGVTYACP